MPPTDRVRPPAWPDGASFAFTVFDDPDAQSYEDGRVVYSYLAGLGFRTTRGVWPGAAVRTPNSPGETCEHADYRRHSVALQEQGFEIGYHHTTKHSSTRDEIRRGLDAFREYFGHDPRTMANHYNAEAIYWGSRRITPPLRAIYAAATFGRTNGKHFGEVEGHPSFWGDLCRDRIRYCRNFVFSDVDTLAACPWMPYHDPARPYVNAWYAATHAQHCAHFIDAIGERRQDQLEASGGACIVYTHFAANFVDGRGALDARVRTLIERLSRKNGWFVPVGTLLDFIAAQRGVTRLAAGARASLEWRWLAHKVLVGAG